MAENADQQVDSGTLTDEQIAEQFPGQDVAGIRAMVAGGTPVTHIKAMLDKAAGRSDEVHPNADGDNGAENNDGSSAQDAAIQYPDFIPEKYRHGTVEEAMQRLADGYKSLESRLGQSDDQQQQESQEPQGDQQASEPKSLADVEAEFVQNNGRISDATYEEFKAKGITPDVLDAMIAGQQAIANQLVTKAHEVAGGAEAYTQMTEWAETNWTDAEITAFDTIMGSGDQAAIMVAIRGLKASYVEANGRTPNLTTGQGKPAAVVVGYQSKAQMTADMRDPRYKTDPAFRKQVEQKIANGSIW